MGGSGKSEERGRWGIIESIRGMLHTWFRQDTSHILRKEPFPCAQFCAYLFSRTAGTHGKLSIAGHSSHCGECPAILSVRRLQAVREKRYAQVCTSGNVAAGVVAEVSHTVRSYLFAGADGRQWHAARHRHRVCYCGAHGDHPRLRPADEARLQ